MPNSKIVRGSGIAGGCDGGFGGETDAKLKLPSKTTAWVAPGIQPAVA